MQAPWIKEFEALMNQRAAVIITTMNGIIVAIIPVPSPPYDL
jgi:hypothetical protein